MRMTRLACMTVCAWSLAAASAVALSTPVIESGQNTLGALTLGVASSLSPLAAPVSGQPLFVARADGQMPAGIDVAVAFNAGVPAGVTNDDLATLVKNANLDFARVQASWYEIEPTPDHYYFARMDALYVALVNQGIRPVIQLFTSPSWAIGYTQKLLGIEQKDNGCYGTFCLEPPSAANYDRWGRFAAQIAKRYPLAAAIEVWNEPNLWGFWHAWSVDPAAYTRLLSAAYDGIKNVTTGNPNMRVLGGAINGIALWQHPDQHWACTQHANLFQMNDCGSSSRWDIPLGDFLDGMLNAGAAAKMDGLSFHAYPGNGIDSVSGTAAAGAWYVGAYPTVKAVLANHSLSGMRLVNSEVGVPTPAFTLVQQDTMTEDVYNTMSAGVSTPNGTATTDAALFYDAFDWTNSPYGWLDSSKLAAPNAAYYHPRPVYCGMSIILHASPTPPGC
jgi:hypothetical protein